VMGATSGDVLLAADAVAAVREQLAPLAALLTPNLAEAAQLLGTAMAASEAAAQAQVEALFARCACPVLLKGGHGTGAEAVDLFFDGRGLIRLARPRLATRHTHGTGCVLSAAVAALIARGVPLQAAVAGAKAFVWQGLAAADSFSVGHGRGPVDCLFGIRAAPLPLSDFEAK
jgi:hydroxymethylpyrimidine/phosphomethylpyrimidine kinase